MTSSFADGPVNFKPAGPVEDQAQKLISSTGFSEHVQMKIAGVWREISASSFSQLTIEDHETCASTAMLPACVVKQDTFYLVIKNEILSTRSRTNVDF